MPVLRGHRKTDCKKDRIAKNRPKLTTEPDKAVD